MTVFVLVTHVDGEAHVDHVFGNAEKAREHLIGLDDYLDGFGAELEDLGRVSGVQAVYAWHGLWDLHLSHESGAGYSILVKELE